MSPNSPISRIDPAASGVRAKGAPGTSDTPRTAKPGDGPAFQVLLEKLEGQARGLQAASREVQGPDELAGAVDRARASFEDALQLRDQLLEAFRSAQQAGDSAP